MKTMKYLFAVIATLIAFTSCEEDGDKIYLQSLSGNELMASTSDVTLSPDAAQQIVLSFAWTDQTIAVSDENVGTAAKVVTNLEASLSEDFSGTVSTTETTSLSHAFTGAQLNTVANAIGATIGQPNAVWFRLGSATGTNIPSAYSNAVKVNVTPYEMDMHTGIILDASKNATSKTLYSADANGVYTGFLGVKVADKNFYLREGNGTIWGNIAEDGKAFVLSNDPSNQWNFWFPDVAGCYYTIIDTNEEEWSATLLSALKITGDITADMTFDTDNDRWIANYNSAETKDVTVRLEGTSVSYDASTGSVDGKSGMFAFTATEEGITLGTEASDITIHLETGDNALILDLSNPSQPYSLTASNEAVDIPSQYPETVDVQRWDGNNMVSMVQLQRTDAENGTYKGTYKGAYDKDDIEHYGFEFIADVAWYRADANDPTKLVTSSNELPKFTFADADDNVTSIEVEITVHLNTLTWEYDIISQKTEGGNDGGDTYPASLDVVCYPDGGSETAMTTLTLTDSENGIYTGTYSGEYRNNINIVDRTNNIWYGCDPDNNSLLSSEANKWNIWFSASGTVTISVNLSKKTYSITENN